jgi:hypothetical protein
MSVEVQIREQIDHLGAYKAALVTAIEGRDDIWDMVDAADDQSYENRVKGSAITVLNTKLNTVDIGSLINEWARLHNEYFAIDAGITDVNTLRLAVAYYRWRVPQYFNDLLIGALGTGNGVPVANVFPREDLSLGTWTSSGSSAGTFTDGDSLETDKASEGIVQTVVTSEIGSGAALGLSITCKRSDDTTVVVTQSITASTAVGTKTKLGGQALTAAITGGSSTSVTMAATGQFKAGTKALLVEGDLTELVEIASISTNTSVTFTAAAKNSFTTSGKLFPLFKDVTLITATTGTAADAVSLSFAPDRDLALS